EDVRAFEKRIPHDQSALSQLENSPRAREIKRLTGVDTLPTSSLRRMEALPKTHFETLLRGLRHAPNSEIHNLAKWIALAPSIAGVSQLALRMGQEEPLLRQALWAMEQERAAI